MIGRLGCVLSVMLASWVAAETTPGPKITVIGEPQFTGRHSESQIEGVQEDQQKIFQTWCTGEIGVRVDGLGAEPCRVHLAYVEMIMSDPWRRVFDIVLNDVVRAKEVCIYRAVGNRHVLGFDFAVTPRDGSITYQQRRSVAEADLPLFCLLQVFDHKGTKLAEQTAYALRPADWELRTQLDLTREYPRLKTPNARTAPPWTGTYKIRAGQDAKLTAADVMGPDGIAYPNWTRVGIPGGIPHRSNTISAADYGALPEDERDDSAALQRAIQELETREGGGVLFIPAGRYFLDRPIVVNGDNIVLRGAGAGKTRLISRFTKRGEAPELHGIAADRKIHPQSYYYVWLDPEGLTGVEVRASGKVVKRIDRSGRWETQVFFRFNGAELVNAVGAGEVDLTVEATYRGAANRSVTQKVIADPSEIPAARGYGSIAAIAFEGHGMFGERIPLATEGRRGDMSLELTAGHGLVAGDWIQLNAPSTPRWDRLIETALKGPQNRTNHYEITKVVGNRVWLGEALRLEFPVVDGSSVQRLRPQLHCGVEDLSFEQADRAMIHGLMFEYGWECWVRGVEITQAGDKALYMPHSKRCEVRDCVFDRVWYNVGGSGYVGWEQSFDCLMDHVTTYAMRHAPVLQWASSGNVIRRSVFHGSDAQWHAGWTNENLFEELVVESSQDFGGYGNGMWASPPEDPGHGPNGPRNVVYNCSVSSPKTGIWLGGMNEAWLILHNRFVVGRGPGVVAMPTSFDHLIADNVFVLSDPSPAAIYLAAADCAGIELVGNRFYGPIAQLVGGAGRPVVENDNRVRPFGDLQRPQPEMRSIFAWQQAHVADIRAEQQRHAVAREP